MIMKATQTDKNATVPNRNLPTPDPESPDIKQAKEKVSQLEARVWWAKTLVIAVLVVAGAIGVAIAIVTLRSDWINEDLRAAEKALTSLETETLKADAAAADQKASEAKGTALKLEGDNLTLRAQVATLETAAADAKENVAGLQKAALDAKASQQRVETDLAKQQERAASAEKDLLLLKDRVRRQQMPRWAFAGPIEPFLTGKPTGAAEIIYVPEDDEAQKTSIWFEAALSIAGWQITKSARPISADDPNLFLPQYSTPAMSSVYLPLFTRVGGLTDLTVIVSPADLTPPPSSFPKEGTAAHTLFFALTNAGYEALINIDNRLPAGTMRIVVGAKK